ncbi:MAG: DUF1820 family protein [Pseudomonadota bacterium]
MYKVTFFNHGKVYELFCEKVLGSELAYGFIEIAGLIFDDENSLVVDPTEEKMREEFADVEVMHLPAHTVVRVERVRKRGACIIRDSHSGEKVTPLPVGGPRKSS